MCSSIKPREDVWIFSSVDNQKFNYNSRYLFEYVREHLPSIHPRYVINDERERKLLAARYGEEYFIESETREGIKKVLEGAVWFTSAGLPVYGPRLGRKRRIINLWHGVPLKRIVLLENHMSVWMKIYFQWIFSANYTYVLTTSKKMIPTMAKSFGVSRDQVRVWGQPRNDLLFLELSRQELLKRLYGITEKIDHIVLYAPTFREYGQTRLFPFDDFNAEQLHTFLEEENIMLLVRYHLEEQEQGCLEGTRIRTINEDKVLDIMEVLSAFDAVITDYSSIYIDFLLLERPLLFLPYDLEEYEEKRGMNFPYEKVTPGPKPGTMKEFMEEIKRLLGDSSYYQEERHRTNRYFNQVQKPCAAMICENILKEMRNEA
jgi:CDP-glycerol glycerophosphotransferase